MSLIGPISTDGKVGFLHPDGSRAIAPIFDQLGQEFREGLTAFVREGKVGFIDGNGAEMVAPKFDLFPECVLPHFREGVAPVRVDRVVQRHVLYLGEINSSQQESWRKTIEIFEESQARSRTVALFPEEWAVPVSAEEIAVNDNYYSPLATGVIPHGT